LQITTERTTAGLTTVPSVSGLFVLVTFLSVYLLEDWKGRLKIRDMKMRDMIKRESQMRDMKVVRVKL